MFGIGPGELIVIILVALVALGPEKLPAAARVLGRFSGELRRLSTEFQRTLHEDAAPARRDEDTEPAPAPESAPAFGPEPDALETANTVPADLVGVLNTGAAEHVDADKTTAGAAVTDTPDGQPTAAILRPEERDRS